MFNVPLSASRSVQEGCAGDMPFRGIVFVHERRTAKWLCQLLSEHPILSEAGIRPEVCTLRPPIPAASAGLDTGLPLRYR